MDTIITMTDASLIRLMSWLSPVFPTGSFAYSAGLEQAVAQGTVLNVDSLADWLKSLLSLGFCRNDAILFAAAWHGHHDAEAITDLGITGAALAGSAQRYREARDQGKAFAEAANYWFAGSEKLPRELPLPVVVGLACGRTSIELETALGAYLNTFISNQLQCAIRLSITGQDGAARILSDLEPVIAEAAKAGAASSIDDLGSCTIAAEIAAMNHETLQPRLFLS
ncbi:MAG: urease accessory protein UreF [Rhizobiaceae bacterium]